MSKLQNAVIAVLILWFITAMYLQHNVGLADNGDFTRSMGSISSGPIGIEPNWPKVGTEDWSRRFYNYWIPFWKLEWDIERPTSPVFRLWLRRFYNYWMPFLELEWNLGKPATSATLLWLPGGLLNYYLYSSTVLYLPILGLFPKLILLGLLVVLFSWIKHDAKYTTILLFSIGAPVALILTDTEYVAYLNSFYQEPASLIFLVILLISILLLKHRSSLGYLLCSLASILLLAMAKPANLYWPLLAIPFVIYVWSIKKGLRIRTMIIVNLTLIFLFTFISAYVTKLGSSHANPFHSLFDGVLAFSDIPSTHLRDLGMEDAAQCVNTSEYSSVGAACFTKYQNQMSFQNSVRVISREPVIIFRMLRYVLDNMQDVSLDYLGKYTIDDPRSKTSPRVLNSVDKRFLSSTNENIYLNLWTRLKFKLFPTGYALTFALTGFLIWFILRLKSTGIQQDLALIGLMCTIACIVDMLVVILGDGKYELIKHLFLSNLLFDIGAVIFLNSVLLYCLERYGDK